MVERCPDKTEVDGPIPSTLTNVQGTFVRAAGTAVPRRGRAKIQQNFMCDHKSMNTEENKKNTGEAWWKPAMVFYGKVTGWIIAPLMVAVVVWKYFGRTLGSQIWFFVLILFVFCITIYGIWREIKIYKKDLEKAEKDNGHK